MGATRIHTQDVFDAAITDAKLASTGVDASTYKAASFTVNAQGRITSAANILTTKGDLLVFTTDVDRLAVGTDGQFMVADSAAGAGLKWYTLQSSDITTALGYTPVNKAGDTMTGSLTLNADPTNALHAATKQYVDNVATGLDVKRSVRTATTVNLAATYDNGTSGVGATLTASANGAISIDGISLVLNDRVLVKDQTTGLQNGIYYVSQVGDVGNPFILTRATDSDNSPSGEITPGMFTFVEEGTLHADQGWVLSTDGTITIGTTALAFSQFSNAGSFDTGDGLYKSGNTIHVGTASASRIVVNADNIDLAQTGVSAGTYTKLTVDLYGRVTVGAQATTTDIAEGTNLYYTDERVDDRVSALIQNGTGITWTYDDNANTLTANVSLSPFDTDDLAEGSLNLYYTDERVDDRISALIQNGTGLTWTYNDVSNTLTGNVSLTPFDTDDLAEGSTNLYHTTARVTTVINNTFVVNETPSGTSNGSNNIFTLANTPVTGTLQLYKNGIRQREGATEDFTISGATITFNASNKPTPNSTLVADYRKAP